MWTAVILSLYLGGILGLFPMLFVGQFVGVTLHAAMTATPSADPEAALKSDDDAIRETNFRFLRDRSYFGDVGLLVFPGIFAIVYYSILNSFDSPSRKRVADAAIVKPVIASWFLRWGIPLGIASVSFTYAASFIFLESAAKGHYFALAAGLVVPFVFRLLSRL